MRRLAVALMVGVCPMVVVAGCSSHDDEVNRGSCERLRDHMIDLRFAGSGESDDGNAANGAVARAMLNGMPHADSNAPPQGAAITPHDVEAHRAAMKKALGENFLASCQKTLTADQIKCALAASDSARALACSSATASK